MNDSFRNFKVYRSSAGSGKTWTLVKEYLRLALSSETPGYFKHILAITFTNKAAAELKSRILDGMYMLAKGKQGADYDESLTNLIASELGIDPERLTARASLAWTEMLHSYSDFSVSTIDSFVYKLIRAFAFDLNLQNDFKVEIDQVRLNDGAIEALLEWVGVDKIATKKLSRFAANNIEEGKTWKIHKSLIDQASAANEESAQPYLDKLNLLTSEELSDLKRKLVSSIEKYENEVKNLTQKALDNFFGAGLVPEAFSRSSLTKYYDKLISGTIVDPSATLLGLVRGEPNFWCPKSKPEWQDVARQNETMVAEDFAAVHALITSDHAQLYKRRKVVLQHWEATMILSLLKKASTFWKEENEVVMVGDFNRTIADIIKDNPAPYVYEKIGEWYHHFLIDEFQDTSVIQWQNFLPLIENALAKGKESMLVGDSKQAIYRWRGGEVEQFDSLPEIFRPTTPAIRDVQSILKREIDEIQLGNNWRSGRAIVEFNNNLFEELKGLADQKLTGYDGHEQKTQSKLTGYVEVANFPEQEEVDECVEGEILLRIRDAISAGYAQSDIVILTRNNKQIRTLASRLLREDFGATTVESLVIDKALSVRFVTTLARYLQRPFDQVAMVAVLGCLTELGCDQDAHYYNLRKISKSGGESLESFFTKTPMSKLGSLSMLELTETLSLEFDLPSRDAAFLEQLLNCIAGLGNPSQSEFNDWWQERGSEVYIEASEEVEGVRLMTIHKAKGLEFPIVIIPTIRSVVKSSAFWFKENGSEFPPILVDSALSKAAELGDAFESEREKALLDELNVLYVGLTRPVERLHWLLISGKKKQANAIIDWVHQSLTKMNPDWDNSQLIEFGEKTTKPELKEKPSEKGQVEMSCSPLHLNPSMKLEELSLDKGKTKATEIGIAVHDVLAEIGNIELLDIDVLLASLARKVNKEIKAEVVSHVKRVMENDDLRQWFMCDSYRERDLIDEQSRIQRPDRICVFENNLAVVDFKTGIVKEEHKVQVEDYVQLLAKIEDRPVSGYLMYTDSLEVVSV